MNQAMFAVLPLLLVVLSGLTVLLLEVFLPKTQKHWIHKVAPLGVVLAGFATLYLFGMVQVAPQNELIPFAAMSNAGPFFIIDHVSIFFYLLFLLITFVVMLMSSFYLQRESLVAGEYYALLLFSLSGLLILSSSQDLITLFIGLEILSMAVYVLVGYRRDDRRSNEGAFRYFLLGSVASAIFLYGIALMYGTVGSTHLEQVRVHFMTQSNYGLSGIGLLFLLIGLTFKAAAVPFHTWAPDAYEGAPMPITCFMATAVKAGAFALILRILGEGLIGLKSYWVEIVVLLSMLTMLVGNIMAFTQSNLKRLLAYSSIVHTGYLLTGIVALRVEPTGVLSAIFYYLFIYTLTSLGVFTLLSHLSSQGESRQNIEDLSGLAKEHPWIAAALALFMFSFIGVPPLGGFFAKYYLFSMVLKDQQVFLVFFALLNSILSIAYYLRIVSVMYFKPLAAHWKTMAPQPVSMSLVASLTSVAVVWAGFGPFNLFWVIPGLPTLIQWMELARLS